MAAMSLRSSGVLLAGMAFILVRALRISPTVAEKVGAVLGLAVGMAPAIWVVAAKGVSTKLVVGYAVLLFAASVILKWLLYRWVLSPYIHPRVTAGVGAVAQGILSASCELGVAALAFGVFLRGLTFWEVIGFGAGAAAVEAAMVAAVPNVHAGGPEGEHVARQISKTRDGPSWLAAMVPLVERGIATVDHIACRALVALGIASGQAWPLAVAFTVFAVTDGFGHYCLRTKWEFGEWVVAVRMYGLLALPALISVVALVLVR
jgi:hypothetical protein